MPYTANFSERFYEKLGHDVVDELVGLVNYVDLAYRTELREQNQSNFQKFESVLRAEMAALEAQLDGKMQVGFAALRAEMAALEARLDGKMQMGFAALRAELATGQATMLRWMVFLFLGAVLTVVGLKL